MNTASSLPLSGLRVLEFTHAVMGPTAGLVLADLGAEVIHIEPPQGDPTRRLKGFGTGYFPFYSRNKKSLAIDLKHDDGKAIIRQLVPTADILVENSIILELKVAANILNAHKAQVINYLKATGVKLAIILNFGKQELGFERIVF